MNRECRWCGAGPINVQRRYSFSGTYKGAHAVLTVKKLYDLVGRVGRFTAGCRTLRVFRVRILTFFQLKGGIFLLSLS
jgi:hypothetical protein